MAVFKCKMCDGNLNVIEGHTICVCPYCDTQQTVPSDSSEKKVNLFNRANRLRSGSEFDKAASVYENIVAEFQEEAEAYWGLCLCKFGIEYVDDPATGKKTPTCHRTSYDSIFDDKNFDLACEYADNASLPVYRAEAKEIDRLQKEILEIANNEEPFDVFICYKETAEDGGRTKDSVLAQDIYEALASKGYKVFFSRITLEDKLGQDYEPYIFSALNSAKVMLAIGTKFEYFNAVWVKNEWSRYLSLMQADKSKKLIPCYCDIDAYDMPKEFSRLQGQDMSKVGFIQDLVRGIGKMIPKGGAGAGQTVVQVSGQQAVEPLIERAFMFLGNNDWEGANAQCERVLDIDPHCGRAYLAKLLAEYSCRREEELAYLSIDITKSVNYKAARQFGVHIEEYGRKAMYNTGCRLLAECPNHEELNRAKSYFEETPDIEDSPEKLALCEQKLAQSEDLTDNLRRIYGSFDASCETANSESLNKVREITDKITQTYPKFIKDGVREPWGPAPVNVWLISLGSGLLVVAFLALFKPMEFGLLPNQSSTAMVFVVIGALFLSILAGFIGEGMVLDCFSGVYIGVMVVVSIVYAALATSLIDKIIDEPQTAEELTSGMRKVALYYSGVGALLIAVAVLLLVFYFKKKGRIHRYRKDSATLEQLTEEMNEQRKKAIAEELVKFPEFPQDFLNECLAEAYSTYKNRT